MILMEHTCSHLPEQRKNFFPGSLHIIYRDFSTETNMEAVYEGGLDVFNSSSEEPDVVVYQKKNGLQPLMAIEIL